METTTSFDLNCAIQQWREELAQSPAFRAENLNELESHLRDSMMALEARGLSAAEAFLVATRRVGSSRALEREFGKVNGPAIWLDRLFWMLIGYQVWAFVSGVIGIVTRNAMFFGLTGMGYDFKSHGPAIPASLFALVNLAGFAGSLALCWWLFCRKGQRFGRWLVRLLHRKATWALTFGALYLLSLSVRIFNAGMQALLMKAVGREGIGDIYASLAIAYVITPLITTAVLVWLTLFLARKRLFASGV